jgi:hypothetical protein
VRERQQNSETLDSSYNTEEDDTSGRRSSWGLVAEGLVILVSILLAFWLEGWGDDREVEAELRRELVSVGRELDRNRQLMAAHLNALDRIVAGAEALMSELDAHPTASAIAVPDTLLVLTLSYNPSFDPSMGGLEALIGSGRLALIRNAELRLGLASLRDLMDDAREEELEARDISIRRVDPLLAPLHDGSRYRRASRDFFGFLVEGGASVAEVARGAIGQQERSATRPLTSFEIVEFPNSLEIRNTLSSKFGRLMSGQVEYRRLSLYLDSLIVQLNRELAEME